MSTTGNAVLSGQNLPPLSILFASDIAVPALREHDLTSSLFILPKIVRAYNSLATLHRIIDPVREAVAEYRDSVNCNRTKFTDQDRENLSGVSASDFLLPCLRTDKSSVYCCDIFAAALPLAAKPPAIGRVSVFGEIKKPTSDILALGAEQVISDLTKYKKAARDIFHPETYEAEGWQTTYPWGKFLLNHMQAPSPHSFQCREAEASYKLFYYNNSAALAMHEAQLLLDKLRSEEFAQDVSSYDAAVRGVEAAPNKHWEDMLSRRAPAARPS